MNEQITSAAELDALTDLVVRLNRANKGLLSQSRTNITSERTRLEGKAEGVRLALSYVEEAIRARPDQPQRVQPSREDVADTLIQARSSGMCRFGKVCDLCDCGLEGHTDDEARRADSRTLIEADAVLALFAQQPTVAEVKAEALREAAADMEGTALAAVMVSSGSMAAGFLRSRADRIEREARS